MPEAYEPPRFLFAGDTTDLPLIERMLGRLPVDAYGQVFIEAASSLQIRPVDAPGGVTVTWLRRDRDGTAYAMSPRGDVIVRALQAWFGEWMPQGAEHDACCIWIGCASSPRVTLFHRALQQTYPQLAPEGPAVLVQPVVRQEWDADGEPG